MDQYAVFGHPISHSKSPLIHRQFAQQTDQALVYTAQEVPLDGFAAALRRFQAAGGKGLNITVPFKQTAYALADSLSARAQLAGAVNTLSLDAHGGWQGDNTDGIGLVRDLTDNHGLRLTHKRVLMLGAGGAVRGVLGPLLDQQPAQLLIANRTLSKAEALAALYPAGTVTACSYAELIGQQFEVIINGTSAGLADALPPLPAGLLAPGGLGYDMVYGNRPTVFVQWAQAQGATGLDGLGMLVEQAAESFYLWRGLRPHTAPVIAALRAAMQA